MTTVGLLDAVTNPERSSVLANEPLDARAGDRVFLNRMGVRRIAYGELHARNLIVRRYVTRVLDVR